MHSPGSLTPQSKLSSIMARATRSTLMPNVEYIDNYVVIPPDGGYGWFIVAAGFICYFLVDGVIYTFGVFLVEISESLHAKPTEVAVASSLMSGFYFLVGPLTCALVNRYGFRIVGFMGGFISGMAFLLSTFFMSLNVFLVLMGVLCGIGFNMIFIPCLLVIGFYFEKWRALATAISMCGSSIGVIAFPPIVTTLMKDLHWTWKFRVLSGLTFVTCACAFTYRPIPPTIVPDPERRLTSATYDSIYSITIEGRDSRQERRSFFNAYHNLGYPTTSDLQDASSIYTIARRPQDDTISDGSTPRSMFINRTDNLSMSLSTVHEVDEDVLKGKGCLHRCCRRLFCFYCRKEKRTMDGLEDVHRPMYRDDILYTGSVYALKEYSRATLGRSPGGSGQKSSISYHKSVTRVPTARDVEENRQCLLCPEAFLRTIATMLHLKLLKSVMFVMLIFSGFFSFVGLYGPFIFLVERATDMHIDEDWASLLLTIAGVANTVGRVMCGVLSWFPKISLLAVNYVTLIIAGISAIVSNYFHSLGGQIGFACVYGFCVSALAVLRAMVVVDLMGLENLTNAFGITSMFFGLGCLIGVPIASVLYEYTGTYDASYTFAGCSLILSGLLLIPLKCVSRWENSRSRKVSFKEDDIK